MGFAAPHHRQQPAESGRPKGQWPFHAAFLKVGEEAIE